MVGEILDTGTHLLATLTRAVYANSPSQWVQSVITRYFYRAPYNVHVVGDILDRLFLTTLTSAAYANSSSQQL